VALNGVTLDIARGALVGIIGHSGSGKSTLLQLISGLEQPDTGTVVVAGQALSRRSARLALHKTVGVAFQYPEYQLFGRTVAEDVGFGPRNLGRAAAEVDARVRKALALVGLRYEDFAERSPFNLSGGEKRRVALAGIIAQDTPALLFDEPTNGLDPQTHQEVLALIARLHRQGKTIVLVTHDMDAIANLAERVVVLNAGRVLMDGLPRQIFARHDELRAVNLGVPQATAFARELGVAGLPLTLKKRDMTDLPLTLEELVERIAATCGGPTRNASQPAPLSCSSALAAARGAPHTVGKGVADASRGVAGASAGAQGDSRHARSPHVAHGHEEGRE
jgi:energy-coupling factor transport system ATP-binding protein